MRVGSPGLLILTFRFKLLEIEFSVNNYFIDYQLFGKIRHLYGKC